jgi:hypothetical protein
MKVCINIDKIFLEGFDVKTTTGLASSVEAELARMIASDGLPEGLNQQSKEVGLVNGDNLTLSQSSSDNPRSPIGAGIARSIYESLQRSAQATEGE